MMFVDFLVDAVYDLWLVLRGRHLPEEHIDRYAIVLIVIVWTSVATAMFGVGVFVADDLGLWEHPVVVTVVFLSWPVIAVSGSLLTYRRIHRR